MAEAGGRLSLKRNILANYASQVYVTLTSILVVPLYVRYMGVEGYGLVGFFAMLQAWFQLLDVGLTPTLSREAARFAGGSINAHTLRGLLRALEGIFIGIAVAGASVMIVGSDLIARDWLRLQHLSVADARSAVMLMAATIAFRWVSGLYRGAVSGFEHLVWLSGFNIAIATARFALVVPILMFIDAGPSIFFGYQLLVAFCETLILFRKTYSLFPTNSVRTRWQLAPLHGLLKFSLSMALTSSIWILVTQTDKLILSKLLPLSEYGAFTLAVMLANGVMFVSAPITAALSPRMTKLNAAHDDTGLLHIYRSTTQLVCVIAIPVALIMAAFPEALLWTWTGRADIAHSAAPILCLYAAGNGVLAISAFPAHLQFAKGKMRLHVLGSILYALLLMPTLVLATIHMGTRGAGLAWVACNLVYFFLWVPIVHHVFLPGMHLRWLLQDVAPIAITAGLSVAVWLNCGVLNLVDGRLRSALALGVISILTIGFSTLASSFARPRIFQLFCKHFKGAPREGAVL